MSVTGGCHCFETDSEDTDPYDEMEIRAKAHDVQPSAALYLARTVLRRGYAVESQQGHAYITGSGAALERYVESPAALARTAHLVSGYRDSMPGSHQMLLGSIGLQYYNNIQPDWWDEASNAGTNAWTKLPNNTHDPNWWADVCSSFCVRRFDDEAEFLEVDLMVSGGVCSCYAWQDSNTHNRFSNRTSHAAPGDIHALEFLHRHKLASTTETARVHVYAMKKNLGHALFVPALQGTLFWSPIWEPHVDMERTTIFGLADRYLPYIGVTRNAEECLQTCARKAVFEERSLGTVRYDVHSDNVGESCECFGSRYLDFEYDALWRRNEESAALWYDVNWCHKTRGDEVGRSVVFAKDAKLPQKGSFCIGSPIGSGYTLESKSVLTAYQNGVSSAPFDVQCSVACDETPDCDLAHAFVETFDYHDLSHRQPPPPSPPSPPSPPPSPGMHNSIHHFMNCYIVILLHAYFKPVIHYILYTQHVLFCLCTTYTRAHAPTLDFAHCAAR